MSHPAALDAALAHASAVALLMQGEVLRAEDICLAVANAAQPLTEEARESAEAADAIDGEVVVGVVSDAVVLLTQTCDLQETKGGKLHCLVAPVVRVPAQVAREAAAWRQLGLVPLPWIDDATVADVTRITTVERSVLVGRESLGRPRANAEELKFAEALTRYLNRPANPDDVNDVLRPFVKRIKDRHDRQSDEGQVLRLVSDVRIEAAPNMDDPAPALSVLLLVEDSDLPSLAPGEELSQNVIDELRSRGLAAACKSVLEAPGPLAKREAFTAVAELWLEPSLAVVNDFDGVGSLEIQVLNGEDLSYARARNAPPLDVQYLTSRRR